ncbi:MAG: SDR family oxidoreductase [Gammaproteobacteria bacterium]|nr:MAG: SDR family oxidoreductase [Gammaproteobacteria bacterium]
MKLKNTCAIITGANRGLGFEIAKHYVLEGAKVTICGRDAIKLADAHHELEKLTHASNVFSLPVDASLPDQVDNLVKTALSQMGNVDVVVANAGVYGTKGPIEEIDWQEWSDAIDINLKGAVLLTRSVLPHFKHKKKGKIIFISGGGATKPLPYLSAYAASKAALVRFCETIAEEVIDYGIDVNAVAPGRLNTRLLDEIIAAGPEKVGKVFYDQSLKQKQDGGDPLNKAAELIVYLATKASDGITGKLISALWDPWQNLPDYLNDLKKTDIYTLRRIVPSDRGKMWGDVE